MKKLDQIKKLTQHQLKLSRTQEVKDFLECDKIKQVIGILKGDKVMADIRLQHFAPREVKAYSSLVIKGWVGS